jgi:hypothetical protein
MQPVSKGVNFLFVLHVNPIRLTPLFCYVRPLIRSRFYLPVRARLQLAAARRTHPGWKERTVAFYYHKFELAESLHGTPRRGVTDQAQLDQLAAQLEPDVLGKVLGVLSSTRPAARLLGISTSAMQRRKGPLVRAVQRQQQQRPKDEFWYSRDPDALEKELHHLRKCCSDEKSLDLVMVFGLGG